MSFKCCAGVYDKASLPVQCAIESRVFSSKGAKRTTLHRKFFAEFLFHGSRVFVAKAMRGSMLSGKTILDPAPSWLPAIVVAFVALDFDKMNQTLQRGTRNCT
jgi:hypothetical protein